MTNQVANASIVADSGVSAEGTSAIVGGYGTSFYGSTPYGATLVPFGVFSAQSLSPYTVEVRFNALLDLSYGPLLNPSNYAIPGLSVSLVTGESASSVLLTTSPQLGGSYTVTVAMALGLYGQPIAPNLHSASFSGQVATPSFTPVAVSQVKIRLVFDTVMLCDGNLDAVTSYTVKDLSGNTLLLDPPVLVEQPSNPTSVALIIDAANPLRTQNSYTVTVSAVVHSQGGQSTSPNIEEFNWTDDWVQPFDRPGLPDTRPLIIQISEFTGEVSGGLLGSPDGQVFFSPALNFPTSGSVIQVDEVDVCTYAFDTYKPPQPIDPNPLFTVSNLLRPLIGTFTVFNGSPNVTATFSQTGSLAPGNSITFGGGTATGTYTVLTVLGTAIVLTSIYTGASSLATATSTYAPGPPPNLENVLGPVLLAPFLNAPPPFSAVLWAPFPRLSEAQFILSNAGDFQNDFVPHADDGTCIVTLRQTWNPLYVALLNDPSWLLFLQSVPGASFAAIIAGSTMTDSAKSETHVSASLRGESTLEVEEAVSAAIVADSTLFFGLDGSVAMEASSFVQASGNVHHSGAVMMTSNSYTQGGETHPFVIPPYVFICARNASTTLNGPTTSGAPTILVTSVGLFPVAPFEILVDSEYMLVTSVTGNTFHVNRGLYGTNPTAHSSGATVSLDLSGTGYQSIYLTGGVGVEAGSSLSSSGTPGRGVKSEISSNSSLSATAF